jgi:hypothetical protein
MEKNVALKEWCIEQAVNLSRPEGRSVDTVIEDAKELEEYVSGDEGEKWKGTYYIPVDDDNVSRIGLAVYTQNKDGRWEASYSTSDKEEHSLVCPHCKELIDITELIKVLRG